MTHRFEGQDLIAEYHDLGSTQLVITFAHFSHRPPGDPFGSSFLRKRGLSHLTLQAKRNHWYFTNEFQALREAMPQIWTPGLSRITYGVSMGGHGALRLAGFFNATRVIAAAPQYSINPDVVPEEQRWTWQSSMIERHRHGMQYRYQPFAQKIIIYDPLDPRDSAHARHLLQIPNSHAICIPQTGHNVLAPLKAAGVLTDFIGGLIQPRLDLSRARRQARVARRTEQSIVKLLWARYRRRDPRRGYDWALRYLPLLHPHDSQSLIYLALLAGNAGLVREARALAARAVQADMRGPAKDVAMSLMLSADPVAAAHIGALLQDGEADKARARLMHGLAPRHWPRPPEVA